MRVVPRASLRVPRPACQPEGAPPVAPDSSHGCAPTTLPADKHLELIARLMGWANAALDFYRRAKAWVLSQGALTLAVLVLLIALLLRWLGWV